MNNSQNNNVSIFDLLRSDQLADSRFDTGNQKQLANESSASRFDTGNENQSNVAQYQNVLNRLKASLPQNQKKESLGDEVGDMSKELNTMQNSLKNQVIVNEQNALILPFAESKATVLKYINYLKESKYELDANPTLYSELNKLHEGIKKSLNGYGENYVISEQMDNSKLSDDNLGLITDYLSKKIDKNGRTCMNNKNDIQDLGCAVLTLGALVGFLISPLIGSILLVPAAIMSVFCMKSLYERKVGESSVKKSITAIAEHINKSNTGTIAL